MWTDGMVWNLLFLTVKESPLSTNTWTNGKKSYMPHDLMTWGEHNLHRTQKQRPLSCVSQIAEPALSVEQARRTWQGNRKRVGCSEDAIFIYHLETQLTVSSQRILFIEESVSGPPIRAKDEHLQVLFFFVCVPGHMTRKWNVFWNGLR